jgi:hypothetical protein
MAHELVTFNDLKKELKLDKSTLQEYPVLAVLKPSVEAAIENFLQRELEYKERTEDLYLSRFGTSMVQLKALPVASVSAVTVTDAYGNTEDLTAQEDFRITPFGIRLFSNHKDLDISVTYLGGYATPATGSVPGIPKDITRAALLQTVYEYQKSPNLGAEMVSNEGGSVTYPELGLLKHVKQLLQPHIHPLGMGI